MANIRQERFDGAPGPPVVEEPPNVHAEEPLPPLGANTLVGATPGVSPAQVQPDISTAPRAGVPVTTAGPNWGAILLALLIVIGLIALAIWLL